MRRQIALIAGIIVSGFFLYLVLRSVPLQEVWQAIQGADIFWIGICLLCVVAGLWTRGIRWRGLLNAEMSQRDAFYIMGITFMLNQLPLRAGEVARGIIATRYDVPFVTAATSIVVERLLDVLMVVLLIAGAITQLPDASPEIVQGAALVGLLGMFGFIVLLGFAHFPRRAHALLNWAERILPLMRKLPLHNILDELLVGLQPLTQWRTLAHMIVWTLISWFFSVLNVYTLLLAFSVTEIDLWLMSVLGIALAALSIALPVNFMALGLFEGAIALAGELVGLDAITYTALGFLTHGVSVLGYIAVGLAGVVVLGIRLSDVRQHMTETIET